jgi:tetratricopeptide (TPR) repeat protein
MIHFFQKEWTEAALDLARAAELAPDSAALHNRAAWLLATNPIRERRDASRALELAQTAVKLDPYEATYWNTLGVAQYRAGRWKNAIETLGHSLSLAHGQDESFDTFFLAMAHWKLGNRQEARTWYARALRWLEEHAPRGEHGAQLSRFRAEAAELLGLRAPPDPATSQGEVPR